ncbi:MAG: acetyl-CoA carboxylase biotin carboxylase subunit [Candidatus Zixiibacteriota bacterium]
MRRVLIANRGEIAVRVIRACRRYGLESAAVYSDADRAALHVRMADFAYAIGPAAPTASYLNIDKLMAVAAEAGADAVHPGYGFLSENPAFAARVAAAGLTWIGPPAAAISLMGDKIAARRLMRRQGVPVVPGSEGAIDNAGDALTKAEQGGFPVLLKAVAGGGGKGMRLVERAADWQAALEGAAREAQRAFGDGRMYWEKYIQQPRHVEIQILGGPDGRAYALFERECSIQRRHQKVIEESPSPIMTPALRAQMAQAAVAAAEACGYVNAGTVEFLVDADRTFYFLEMNTRLQVEHPVTEMVTGIDLVVEQFRIAEGVGWQPPQLPPEPFGHAIEFRIYAEDPQNNFLPAPGTLEIYREPQGPGVRVDSGVYQGADVSVHYDPLVAKLVVWGRDRAEAMARSETALEEFAVGGVMTTIGFHRQVLQHSEFRRGNLSTDFIARHFGDGPAPLVPNDDLRRALAVSAALYAHRRGERRSRFVPKASGGGNGRATWATAARQQAVQRWPV